MQAPTFAQFIESVEASDYSGNSDRDYLKAVYQWVDEYAVNNWDDVEYILELAEEYYAGNFARDADYGEHVAETYLEERLDELQALAQKEPIIPITFDWEQFARLVLPNTYGWNWSSYGDDEPGTGAYYFREPR